MKESYEKKKKTERVPRLIYKGEENYELQPQLQAGVSKEESVPFLYRQYSKARRMGKPQPQKRFEFTIPSFEPSTSSAIKIQRVTLLPLP